MHIDPKDLDRAVEKALYARQNPPRKKVEFSKILMAFIGLICGGSWVIAAVAWLMWREFPAELVQYTQWFFVTAAAYMVKSGYENRAKISNRDGDEK